MKSMTTWWIAFAAAGALLPAMARAQPAPLHNPVVARGPCSADADGVRMSRAHAAKPTRARYDAVAGRDGIAIRRHGSGVVVPAASSTDIRRDIVLELSGACN